MRHGTTVGKELKALKKSRERKNEKRRLANRVRWDAKRLTKKSMVK
jgi:hypothetical protein